MLPHGIFIACDLGVCRRSPSRQAAQLGWEGLLDTKACESCLSFIGKSKMSHFDPDLYLYNGFAQSTSQPVLQAPPFGSPLAGWLP